MGRYPTLGIYRECADQKFREAAGNFIDDGGKLMLRNSSRLQRGLGVTVLQTREFDKLGLARRTILQDKRKAASEDLHRISRNDRQESEIFTLVQELDEVLDGCHFDIDPIAKKVQKELDVFEALHVQVSSMKRLGRRKNDNRTVTDRRRGRSMKNGDEETFIGVVLTSPEEIALIAKEEKIARGVIELALLGEFEDIQQSHTDPLGPHITIAKSTVDRVDGLCRIWVQNEFPGVIELGPPKVRVFDSR